METIHRGERLTRIVVTGSDSTGISTLARRLELFRAAAVSSGSPYAVIEGSWEERGASLVVAQTLY